MQQLSEDDLRHLRRIPKEPPVITRETLDDTLEIAKMFENRDELLDYYAPRQIDESGDLTQVQSYKSNKQSIIVKLVRRQQMRQMLANNCIVELEKYPQRQRNSTSCGENCEFTIQQISQQICVELKKELKRHSLKTSGNKKELIQRLKTHYETFHSNS